MILTAASVIFVAVLVNVRVCERWMIGHTNVITKRILKYPEATEFFVAAGMPADERVTCHAREAGSVVLERLTAECPEFFTWLRAKGSRTMMNWVVWRGESYTKPWTYLTAVRAYDPLSTYAPKGTTPSALGDVLATAYALVPPPLVLAGAVLLLVPALLMGGVGRLTAMMCIMLALAMYSQAVIAHHADVLETRRHIMAALILYRCLIIGLLGLTVIVCARVRRCGPAGTSEQGSISESSPDYDTDHAPASLSARIDEV